MSSSDEESIHLPYVVTGLEDTPILFVNWATIRHDGAEFILTLGQVSPPVLLGTPEEQSQQAKLVGAVPIRVVGRFGIPANRMVEIVRTLGENLSNYEQQKV
jgi:hypothetical protein